MRTKLANISDLVYVGDGAILVTREPITKENIILAQSPTDEKYYTIVHVLEQDYLKKGFVMLVLTEKENN